MKAKVRRTDKATTKLDTILVQISRKNGATTKTLNKRIGWKPHSVRAAISRLRKKGHIVERAKTAKGDTIYRAIS